MKPRTLNLTVGLIFLVQVVLLMAAGAGNVYQTSPDGIAYVRIAEYWITGQVDLVVNGYWGPMLSWMIAPLLPFTGEPLLAARIAMGLSAVIFLVGCLAVFRRLELPPVGIVIGLAVAALMSVRYSVLGVSPDLLVGGLIALGASRLLRPEWLERRRFQVATGLLFGLAYLAKAVALPIFFVMTVAVCAVWWVCRPAARRDARRAALVTMASFTILALPWATALSIEYGRPVFSTTARIAHTVAGPRDVDRNHPFGTMFAVPPDGRLTWWEDPTNMPYRHWSPLSSAAYLRHQGHVIAANARVIGGHLGSFDWFRIGVFAAFIGLVLHAPWRRNFEEERWRWAGVAVLSIGVVFLPVYALGVRYYFAAFPFLVVAAIGLVLELTKGEGGARSAGRLVGLAAVAISFGGPRLVELAGALGEGGRVPSSRVLADRLIEAGMTGPVAGDTVEGLMLSHFLGEPFFGGYPAAGPAEYRASGATLILAVRTLPINEALREAEGFDDLDDVLFPSAQAAAACPLKVYRRGPGEIPGLASTDLDKAVDPSGR